MHGRRDRSRIEPIPPPVESRLRLPDTIQKLGAWITQKFDTPTTSPETSEKS